MTLICEAIRLNALELGGTLVFVVFVAVETKLAIQHLLGLARKK
jgi:hypothetical protein